MISIVSDSYMYLFKYKQVMEKGTWDRVWLKKLLMSSGNSIIYGFFFTGLCGNARLADVGGPGFLLPLPQKDKVSIQCFYYLYFRKTRSLYNIKQNV